jgi:hypothetical protein
MRTFVKSPTTLQAVGILLIAGAFAVLTPVAGLFALGVGALAFGISRAI